MDKTSEWPAGHLLLAAGAGALLMYLLDPQQGRRRAALARDTALHLARKGAALADAGLRDLGHRATGVASDLRWAVRRDHPADEVLVERVRAQLGRWVSHPHAVEVGAAAGGITLSGPVLRREVPGLLRCVRGVRGVQRIDNRLEVHESAGNLPALQGGTDRRGPHHELMQAHWAPGPRLLSLAAGSGLAAWGLLRRDAAGALLAMAGAALAVRAATNRPLRQPAGERTGVQVHKTIRIAAPREMVFEHWSNPENFPRFMSHVEEVRPMDDGRSHWVVRGPAGRRIEWDAEITEQASPQLLAWRSLPGSPVEHAGRVYFDAIDGGTRVTVEMSYRPPGGTLGHAAAWLLGHDPKHELDDDLMRMKAFIETGIAPHDAAARH